MKKLYALWLALLLSLLVLAGCGGADENEAAQDEQNKETVETESDGADETENGAFPVTIKDATDNGVEIESKPERIVSLIPSNTEISFALGLGDDIVGVNDNDNYPEEVLEIEKIGGMDLNIEKIISLQPDLVLAHGGSSMGSSPEGLQQLRDAGITVLVVNDATSFVSVYEAIEMIGKATGTQKKANEIVTDMQTRIENIKEKAAAIKEEDRKKVYIEIMPAPEIYSAGKNTFMDEMLEMINAENIVTEESWPKVDQEAIIASNPDVIITTYGFYTPDAAEQLLSREGWQDVNAVKNEQVFDVNSDVVTRSGPRLVEGVEEVAKAVYPDVFNQ
ncbi:ABC transporter substrate-binding protein [Bacillus tuaregi]|uniref:ABC transporter substrate-binding protein n=1 Tax=Bacillus tuaregi TaxID=1816695 RepID=UPI0008F83A83|nr:ABC transporter substrate-binding protein [Bacillus tuaregi]